MEEEKMSWYFEKITTEEKEKMEKIIEKIRDKSIFTVYAKDILPT